MDGLIRQGARAWLVGAATLLSAGTAVSALAAGGGPLTPLRAGLAAADEGGRAASDWYRVRRSSNL